MSLQKKLFYVAHAFIATKVDSVRKSVIKAGGRLTWDFSQVREPVRSKIVTDSQTAIGICEMVSAKWVARSMQGDHISNWLGSGNQIDLTAVGELMALFKAGKTSPGGQTMATRLWLHGEGVRDRAGNHHITQARSSKIKRRVHAATIAQELCSAAEAKRTHKMLGVWGPHFAHACACWSDDEVHYMDPNFGEFQFDTAAAFMHWFPKYWDKAGYGTPTVGLSESFEIHYYVPKPVRR